MPVKLREEELGLLAGRALFWPRRRTLIVADAHFGKTAAFREAGVPVPEGSTADDLARLSAMLAESRARRLIFLGDFLHAAAGRAETVMDALAGWRRAHQGLEVLLVTGNHDRKAGPPPEAWGFRVLDEPLREPPFLFSHEPPERRGEGRSAECGVRNDTKMTRGGTGDGAEGQDSFPEVLGLYTLAGHVHPAVVLHDVDGSSLRLPCFYFGRHYGLLPAFGSFTGTHAIRPRAGDGVYVIAEAEVVAVGSGSGEAV